MIRRLATARHEFATLVLAVLVGLLHRRAATTPWADDRLLSADPAWYQLSAPFWHATIPGSSSVAARITLLFDPLTTASAAGDARAIAAVVIAVAAAELLSTFRRAGVSLPAALLLCLGLTALVLPVSSIASVAYAIQVLAATAMLLPCSGRPEPASARLALARIALLAAATILGTLNHPAFVAFAAGVWIVEARSVHTGVRRTTIAVALASSAVALIAASWILTRVPLPPDTAVDRPGTLAFAAALVTGRFAAAEQVTSHASLIEALSLASPAPLVLGVPLTLLGFARAETRRLAAACGLAALATVIFAAGTWLPDLAIATAPARIAILLLSGLGLAYVTALPLRGARALALAAGAVIGVTGLVTIGRAQAEAETADMQAFVNAGVEAASGAAWTADRLATMRALVARDEPGMRSTRRWARADAFRPAPDDRRLIAFDGGDTRPLGDGLWLVPRELPHGSAAGFVESQRRDHWIAVALSGGPANGFCRDLLNRLRAPAPPGGTGVALLARVGAGVAPVADATLDVPYGTRLEHDSRVVPAHFHLETSPDARIAINGSPLADVPAGMLIAVFDPWRIQSRAWSVGDCDAPSPPTLVDRRLKAAIVLEANGPAPLPHVPVVDTTRVEVPIGEAGNAWFDAGWHAPEAPGPQQVRWSGALDAHVPVLVSHRQALSVSLIARPGRGKPEELTLSWNGEALAPEADADGQSEWIVPRAMVLRGRNVLTLHVPALVSPASLGASGDARLLGAAVSRLSIEPRAGGQTR